MNLSSTSCICRCHRLQNEWLLLNYASKTMVGRNLIAVAILFLLVLFDVFNREVGGHQTRFQVAMFVFEMFAPGIGILMLTNLLSSESEHGCDDLLRSSTIGFTTIAVRKILYGLSWTAAVITATLLLLHFTYTRIDFETALMVTLPGAFYFGMIGLLTATITKKSLVGYTTAFCLMAVSAVVSAVEPLGFHSFAYREQLNGLRFFEESNWLIAKWFFLAAGTLLATCGLWITRHEARPRRAGMLASGCLMACYAAIHAIWVTPDPDRPGYPEAAIVLDVRQDGNQLMVLKAQNTNEWKGPRKEEATKVRHIVYEKKAGNWSRIDEGIATPCYWVVPEAMDVDAQIEIDPLRIAATAHIKATWNGADSTQVYFRIPWNYQVRSVTLNDSKADFRKYGDLVTVASPSLLTEGQSIEMAVEYEGKFQHFKKAKEFDDNFIATRKWLPTFGAARYFQATATITVPSTHTVAAAVPVCRDKTEAVYRIDVGQVKYFGLCLGRFHEYKRMHGATPISLLAVSVDEELADSILDRCAQSLDTFEALYGKFPHERLSIVEHPYLAGRGRAENAMVSMNCEVFNPEHRDNMMDVIIPHEIAHQWWGMDYPIWVAEGIAVFSNILFLERNGGHQSNGQEAVAKLMTELDKLFEDNRRWLRAMKDEHSTMYVYTKAAYLWLMLREHLGEERTIELVNACADRIRAINDRDKNGEDRHEAILELLARKTSDECGAFVANWVSTVDQNDPALVALSQQKTASGHLVSATIHQNGECRFPVRLRFTLQDGTHRTLEAQALERKHTVSSTFDQPVVSAHLNPGLYLDWNRHNNTAMATTVGNNTSAQRGTRSPTSSRNIVGWTTFTTNEGLVSGNARCFHVDEDNHVYVGHEDRSYRITHLSASVFREGSRWESLERAFAKPNEDVTTVSAVATTEEGAVWVAGRRANGRGNAIVQLRDTRSQATIPQGLRKTIGFGNAVFVPNPDSNCGIPGHVIYQLMVDTEDRLWIGTDQGVSVLDSDGICQHFDIQSGLPGNEVFAMMRDASGTIWIGTEGGVASYGHSRWKQRPEFGTDAVLALTEDRDGRLWAGTYRSGLLVFDTKAVRSFTPWNSAMRHRMVTALTSDGMGRVWTGTTEGIVCFEKGTSRLLTTSNSGLPSNRINALVVDRQDHLWIGTDKGVTRYELAL